MFTIEANGINSFLVNMSKMLMQHAVRRETRGFICYELPAPVLIKINNPLARHVTVAERKWNYMLPYAESLWIALGRNDVSLPGYYVKNLYNFSDDGLYIRAGYGSRLRHLSGVSTDYKIGHDENDNTLSNFSLEKTTFNEVDQFKYIESIFLKDKNTRQAVIDIADQVKDCFDSSQNLKVTKDFPCTRSIQFIINNGKLDMIVHMRSNDFIWGATAVNIFNFTYMQEYFSNILSCEVGTYYHFVTNFHYYDNFHNLVERLSKIETVIDPYYRYKASFSSLKEFDILLSNLEDYEYSLRTKQTSKKHIFQDEFFDDWAMVFYQYHTHSKVEYQSDVLNLLINGN